MVRWFQGAASGLMLLLLAGPSGAQVNLGWNDTGPSGYHFRQYDCAGNDGEETMVASFVAPAGVTQLVRLEAVIDFCSGGLPFPDWWKFNSCRLGALTATTVLGPDQYQYVDYWEGRGNPSATFIQQDVNLGRIVVDIQIPPESATPLTEGVHYYAFVLKIDHSGTTGPEACAGCDSGLCFVLNDVRLIWPEGETRLHGSGINMVVWQQDLVGCPFVVPVVPTTWGGIKALVD